MANVVVALLSDLQQAFEVVSRLRQADFDINDISIVSSEIHGMKQHGSADTMRSIFGDLERHNLPGIGSVFARGPLAHYMGGDMRLIDSFTEMGAEANDEQFYLEALRRGNTLVAVATDSTREPQAVEIMSQLNPLPMKSVAEHWRKSGWKGYDVNAQPLTAQDMDREGKQVLPIIEEEVRAGKRQEERGGVRVHSPVTGGR